MANNNRRAVLAGLAALFIARTAGAAGIEISGVRAALSATEPRRIEIYLVLRNATAHELELLKAECALADAVELKQRSYGAAGEARLWPVAKLEVATGASLRLNADGRFFQLSGLAPGVRAGQQLPLTLTFEDEPPVTLQLIVEAPTRP